MQRLLLYGICVLVGIAPVAAQTPAASRATRVDGNAPPRILAGTPATAFGAVDGSALDSANGPLPDSLVRLRDVRFGRGVASQWTDKAGRFTFAAVDPGSYVVELLGKDQAVVLATSQLVVVDGGETLPVIVRLPSREAPFAGVLGTNARALAILAAAATAGILTATVAQSVVSPE